MYNSYNQRKLQFDEQISIERVVVQNILHGLSPSLSDSLDQTDRWQFVSAAIPHIMHACAAILEKSVQSRIQRNRNSYYESIIDQGPLPTASFISDQQFEDEHIQLDKFEIKLLYAMHWSLIDGATECCDDLSNVRLPIGTVQLFIYLFAPLFRFLHKSDFNDLRLRSAIQKLWEPLWAYRMPTKVVTFCKIVHPTSNIAYAHRNKNRISYANVNEGNFAADNQRNAVTSLSDSKQTKSTNAQNQDKFLSLQNNQDETGNWNIVFRGKEGRNQRLSGINKSFLYSNVSDFTEAPIAHMSSMICNEDLLTDSSSYLSENVSTNDVVQQNDPRSSSSFRNPRLATVMDIAVVRTLFSPNWSVHGYIWCLKYLANRVSSIADDILQEPYLRIKSSSYPCLRSEMREQELKDNEISNFAAENTLMNARQNRKLSFPLLSINSRLKLLKFYRNVSKMTYIDEEFEWADQIKLNNENEIGNIDSSKFIPIGHIQSKSTEHPHRIMQERTYPVKSNLSNLSRICGSENSWQNKDNNRVANNLASGKNKYLTDQKFLRCETPEKSKTVKRPYSINDLVSTFKINCDTQYKHIDTTIDEYISHNGRLCYAPIIIGMHAVVCKLLNYKVLVEITNIIEVLLTIGAFSQGIDEFIDLWIGSLEQTAAQNENCFFVAIDTCLRILKYLGCPICSSSRSLDKEQLRSKVRLILDRLKLVCYPKFCRYIREFALQTDLKIVISTVHSMTGFCSSSPIPHTVSALKCSNFYTSNEPTGIVSVFMSIVFEPIIYRIATNKIYLHKHRNNSHFADIKLMIYHVREVYGSTYYITAYGCLLKEQKRFNLAKKQFDNRYKCAEKFSKSASNFENAYLQYDEDMNETFKAESKASMGNHIHQINPNSLNRSILVLKFLMDNSPLICIPDPLLLNTILEIQAPIITKGILLLHTVNLIHKIGSRCNTSSQSDTSTLYPSSNIELIKLYFTWADAVSYQLEYILELSNQATDKSQFWSKYSQPEDYYHENLSLNFKVTCPHELRILMIAILLEIVKLIREFYLTTRFTSKHGIVRRKVATNERKPSQFSTLSLNSTASGGADNNKKSDSHIQKTDSGWASVNIYDSGGSPADLLADDNKPLEKVPVHGNISKKVRKMSILHTRKLKYKESLNSLDSYVLANQKVSLSSDIIAIYKEKYAKRSPYWIMVIMKVLDSIDYNCPHDPCTYNCYKEQSNNCMLLLHAVLQIPTASSKYAKHSDGEYNGVGFQFANLKPLVEEKELLKTVVEYQYKRISSLLTYNYSDYYNQNKKSSQFDHDIVSRLYKNDTFNHFLHARTLSHIPLRVLCINSALVSNSILSALLPIVWKLVLDPNTEVSKAASTLLTLAAIRIPESTERFIKRDLQSSTKTRYYTVLKLNILWKRRYHYWLNVESFAKSSYKILPPVIQFAMPSPMIGQASIEMADPPFVLKARNTVDEVAVSQDEVKTVVTTVKSRKKHKLETLQKAFIAEQAELKLGREKFILTDVPLLQEAASQDLAVNLSSKISTVEGEQTEIGLEERIAEDSIPVVQMAFPSCFARLLISLIDFINDAEEIAVDGTTVSISVRRLLYTCLVEDPVVFSRFFLDISIAKDGLKTSMKTIRKMFMCYPKIPPKAAYIFFNSLLGLVMNLIQCPSYNSLESTNTVFSVLWMIAPHLHNISWKDLKQLLRKEQCDLSVLVSSSVPATKKLIVHGLDMSQIPTQILVQDDTKFATVIQDSCVFFGLQESKRDKYYVIDNKTGQIHVPETYVRDFYFFKRNIYPQLSIITMMPKEAARRLESAASTIKVSEINKVLFTRSILDGAISNQHTKHLAAVLVDEFIKCPSFPRRSLETDYSIAGTILDHQLLSLDLSHKLEWINLICTILFNIEPSSLSIYDLSLFVNVLNGTFIMHCENYAILRAVLANYINLSRYYKHIFEINGYTIIIPAIIVVYCSMQSNDILCSAIEFTCKQFYILHRTPFILQVLGSLSGMLETSHSPYDEANSPLSRASIICQMLFALEHELRDNYDIMQLVHNDKNIKSLDFCYADDDPTFRAVESISICVTVIGFAPSMTRSIQMLNILDAILPFILKNISNHRHYSKLETQVKAELKDIENINVSLLTLISESDLFTSVRGGFPSNRQDSHRHENRLSRSFIVDDDSFRADDRLNRGKIRQTEDVLEASYDLRLPGDRILSIVSTYVKWAKNRLEILSASAADSNFRHIEILDSKSYYKLSEIAQVLLKLGIQEPNTLGCKGIQSFFQDLCPSTNWRDSNIRPALLNVLRRLDRTFGKSTKKFAPRKSVNWEALAGILNGLFTTLQCNPDIAHYSQTRSVITASVLFILRDNPPSIMDQHLLTPQTSNASKRESSSTSSEAPTSVNNQQVGGNQYIFPCQLSIDKTLIRAVVKLSGRYIQILKEDHNLDQLVGHVNSNESTFPSLYLHYLIPLLGWALSGREDATVFNGSDIQYIFESVTSVTKMHNKPTLSMASTQHLTITESMIGFTPIKKISSQRQHDQLVIIGLITIKFLIAGFASHLSKQSVKIYTYLSTLLESATTTFHGRIFETTLNFVDFLLRVRNPVYLLIVPVIGRMLRSKRYQDDFKPYIDKFQKLLNGESISSQRIFTSRREELLGELLMELKLIKQTFVDGEHNQLFYSTKLDNQKQMTNETKTNLPAFTKRKIYSQTVTKSMGKRKLERIGLDMISEYIQNTFNKYESSQQLTSAVQVRETKYDKESPFESTTGSNRLPSISSHIANIKSRRPTSEKFRPKERLFSRRDFKMESDSSNEINVKRNRRGNNPPE
ncbi:hypothetical protein GJ496_001704 [Pomphorhynchus laevis]|nr:hypothetical protein GJ496_001704 [Pomphorhynchus laevis]